jgi:serine/threonine protein kinase
MDSAENSSPMGESATLVPGHQPEEESVQFTMDSYQILKEVGKGGMGEVYLAYDTSCGRRIALKKIRADLNEHPQMHNRFLKEARITSQLTHPSIIPIYSIHGKDSQTYYTMPYVQGMTFKQLLRQLRSAEKNGHKHENAGGSIPYLIRIFLNVCQAIAYAHSKGVLHRDIKPENIILGQFGEVLILDWGLAKLVGSHKNSTYEEEFPQVQDQERNPLHQITRLGKVVGTVSYMAPERAMGSAATVQSDVYSLGVILYQILTLRLPFKRGNLKQFREKMHLEVIYDPIEIAPYRDVPKVLSRIVFKCLSTDLDFRYHSVPDLLHDLESYIEGRSEWFQVAQLDILNKADWEFQENVLIAEHIAITRGPEVSDWVSLMISKSSFSETIMLEATVKLGEKGHGIGFLLGIPEISQRTHLNDGYCLWLGSELNHSTKLLRSTVEVMHNPELYLQRHEWYRIKIEKIDNKVNVFINGTLQLSYTSYLPLVGTHVGLLARDADFTVKDFFVYVGSQNVMVKCLAVPDAFLAKKDFLAALSEYRRIGYSFPGRAEGREAMFRAGITLLEQARASETKEKAAPLYEQALQEFEKLHKTPGAPLEYLGKALVYQTMNDNDEEVKCFELAFRRYPKHPLLPVLQEQILYRMHTSSRYNRLATYRFILLVLRHMQELTPNWNVKKLFISLKKYWEPLPFIIQPENIDSSVELDNMYISTVLSFWLSKHYILAEILEDLGKQSPLNQTAIMNALYSLIEMGALKTAKKCVEKIESKDPDPSTRHALKFMDIAILAGSKDTFDGAMAVLLPRINKNLDVEQERSLLFLIKQAIRHRQTDKVHWVMSIVHEKECVLSPFAKNLMDAYHIWSFLLDKNWKAAERILNSYPYEDLLHESSLLYFLYGCWLYVSEGQEIAAAHFSGSIEITHPRTWTLFNQFYNGRINFETGWIQKAFAWEKRQLYLQLSLFYDCIGDSVKSQYYQDLEQKVLIKEPP